MKKSRILFIYPVSFDIYKKSKISVAAPQIPLISIAQLSAIARKAGYLPFALDLSVSNGKLPEERVVAAVKKIKPDYCAITFTTTLSKSAYSIAKKIKEINPEIITVAGGCHASIMPEEVLNSGGVDIAVRGEGEITLKEILSGKRVKKINGVAFKDKSGIIFNKQRELIDNLDDLPLPDYSVFNSKNYFTPRLSCKKNPVAAMETSRGCVYNCIYCNKSVFGKKFRYKSPQRVVKEMIHILKAGYKEIQIWDDGFGTNVNIAKGICREIIRKKIKVFWNIHNGMRADKIDQEILVLLKKSGCYRIAIGVESGNQNILDIINKGITLKKIQKAFKLANDLGIETIALCMIGLPGETEATMRDTINFVRKLNPTIPKANIFIPFPGTQIYNEWDKKGHIISKDWSKYLVHNPEKIYNHPNLDWKTINKYYNLFYKKTMLNKEYILRRIIRGIKKGEIFFDVYYFIKSLKWGW